MNHFQMISGLTRKRVTLVAAGASLIGVAAIIVYVARVNNRIALERERQETAAQIVVDQHELRAPSTDGLMLYLNSSDVRAVANFDGVNYLATSGGLVALDGGGNIQRRYTSLDGLPDVDLTSLAVFRERLFIGTVSAGLLSFDGHTFTSYSFKNPKAVRVSVLVPAESELLIGTLDGGLFEYDGERFTRRFNSATGADFSRVTSILPFESRLYIGTQDAGLYIWREGHIERIGTNDKLPSPHVTAITPLPPGLTENGSICVATDFGVVALNDAGEVTSISNRPNITSLAVSGPHLWAGLFSGGIVDLNSAPKEGSPAGNVSNSAETPGLPRSAPATLAVTEGRLWVLTSMGAFVRDDQTLRPGFEPTAGAMPGDPALAADHITALATDGASRLWVGYFDRGIDLLATETGDRLSHIEDDRVREINYLAFDTGADRILAATSRGLVAFAGNLKQTVTTREQGLVNESVAHIALASESSLLALSSGSQVFEKPSGAVLLATAGGLTELAGGRARSITAFHGLASNHLYTSASLGSRLFVGSLAGLIELEGLRVVRTYKTSNSRLSHDWVTSLAGAEGTLYIGTNGGGVDALLPTGEWVNFAGELGKFEVNQNAMHYDGERLYVGTSDRGLLVYNTRDRRWNRISAGLPSQSVTAITSDYQFLFVGTMNGLVRIEKRVVG